MDNGRKRKWPVSLISSLLQQQVLKARYRHSTGGDDGAPHSAWQRDSTVWRRESNCSNVRIKGSGHLVTQTVPDELGTCPFCLVETVSRRLQVGSLAPMFWIDTA